MSIKYVQKCSISNNQNQWNDYHQIVKNITDAGEDAKKRELFYTVGGNVN
jgi:hypothetical protein